MTGADEISVQAGERRTFRWLLALFVVLTVIGAFAGAKFDPSALWGEHAARGARRFFQECWPPRTDTEFLLPLLGAAADTVAIAAVGTALALLVGFPLGVIGSRVFAFGSAFGDPTVRRGAGASALWVAARGVCAILRSIPEVVWALLFVRVTGLGALPAVAALGVAYGGLLGKVFSEQLEDVPMRPVAALEAVGAGRVAAFAWGALPQAIGSMIGYAAYRFECAIRASALMGLVGAGGLGFRIEVSSGDGLYGEVLTETLILVAIVALVEVASDAVRRRVA